MIPFKTLISATTDKDLVFYRIGTIMGIVTVSAFIFFYKYMINEHYPYLMSTVFIIFVYFVFLITSLINKYNKYVYLLAVISIYSTTLFFINLMIKIDFQQNVVLMVSISISTLANGFKSEKIMKIYLVSMIFFSSLSILLFEGLSIYTIITISPLIIWPLLSYYMLKSKFNNKAEIEEKAEFLQVVFKSIKDPTILIDKKNMKIINCSESLITEFKLGYREDVVGKNIIEIDKLYFNGILSEKNILDMDILTKKEFQFELDVDGAKKSFKININNFLVNHKSYILFKILDITVEKNKNNIIYNMAFTDDLTKIDNRRSGISKLKKTIMDYEKTSLKFAVYFMDIDRFKEINDKYGHDSGDKLLELVANRLVKSTGENDIVSRIGGDEFMIIAKDIKNKAIVDSIAQRIIGKFQIPIKLNNEIIPITISIGTSLYPKHGKDYKDLMRIADVALYESKKLGGDQYKIFEE